MSIEQAVIIEYCNLPMRIAFQNLTLAGQIKELLVAYDYPFERIRDARTTFRQLVYLHEGDGIPLETCQMIFDLMAVQDQVCPQLLTERYPYLLDDNWMLKMSDVSYMKVDVKNQDDLQFCIEKIVGSGLELCFYPYDQEEERKLTGSDIVSVQGKRLLRIKVSSRKQFLSIMKGILLDGTVDLTDINKIEYGEEI